MTAAHTRRGHSAQIVEARGRFGFTVLAIDVSSLRAAALSSGARSQRVGPTSALSLACSHHPAVCAAVTDV
jgi:hypothetical protein